MNLLKQSKNIIMLYRYDIKRIGEQRAKWNEIRCALAHRFKVFILKKYSNMIGKQVWYRGF